MVPLYMNTGRTNSDRCVPNKSRRRQSHSLQHTQLPRAAQAITLLFGRLARDKVGFSIKFTAFLRSEATAAVFNYNRNDASLHTMPFDTPTTAHLRRPIFQHGNRNDLMTHRSVHINLQHTIVEWDGVRRIFATATPRCGVTLQEQTESVLQDIKTLFQKEATAAQIVMQSVFMKNINDLPECRAIVEAFYGEYLPATTYVVQPPCDGNAVSIEVWGIGGGPEKVGIERIGRGLTIARHNGVAWAYLGDIRPETSAGPIHDRAASAFRLAGERLCSAGWKFDEVVRAWFYLGNITGQEEQTLRYHEMNRARAGFYQNVTFGAGLTPRDWTKPVFPASTGIGTKGDDMAISCLALRPDGAEVALVPLENPLQVAAYDYAHQYGPERPKFVRAMAVVVGESVTTFISGTASITASESRFDDDIERQTHQTLDNIAALIAADNFRSHGRHDLGATLGDLALARVYVKRQSDYPAAKAICQARLGELPIIYALGDICRSELLLEIEAIAFSHRRAV